jgi:hypothetical protein
VTSVQVNVPERDHPDSETRSLRCGAALRRLGADRGLTERAGRRRQRRAMRAAGARVVNATGITKIDAGSAHVSPPAGDGGPTSACRPSPKSTPAGIRSARRRRPPMALQAVRFGARQRGWVTTFAMDDPGAGKCLDVTEQTPTTARLCGPRSGLSGARTAGLIDALTEANVMVFTGEGCQGADGTIGTPFKRHHHRPRLHEHRKSSAERRQPCHARIRVIGERAVATLKLRKSRRKCAAAPTAAPRSCRPSALSEIAGVVFTQIASL